MKTILTLAALLVALFLSATATARAQKQRQVPSRQVPAKPIAPPVEAYKRLRGGFFEHTPKELGFEKTGAAPKVYGVLMEIGAPGFLATVVSLRTGEASMYRGDGSVILGGGSHEKVRAAVAVLHDEAEKHLAGMKPTETFPHARLGRVKFYLLTFDGIFTAEAGINELWERHKLAPLFAACNEVGQQLANTSDKK